MSKQASLPKINLILQETKIDLKSDICPICMKLFFLIIINREYESLLANKHETFYVFKEMYFCQLNNLHFTHPLHLKTKSTNFKLTYRTGFPKCTSISQHVLPEAV